MNTETPPATPPTRVELGEATHDLANILGAVSASVAYLDDCAVLDAGFDDPALMTVSEMKGIVERFPEILKRLRRHI